MKQLLVRVAALVAIAIIGLSLAIPRLAVADEGSADAGSGSDATAPHPIVCTGDFTADQDADQHAWSTAITTKVTGLFPGYLIDACERTFRSPEVIRNKQTNEVMKRPKLDAKGQPVLDAVSGEPMMVPVHDPALDVYELRTHATTGTKLSIGIEFGTGKILHTTKLLAHADRIESQGIGMALLFWAFAAASVGGALFVVTRRNLIAAVMGMVGSFLGIAAIYMMLYAHFLAVVQMLVYAGAIMVLFVFVIMILNRPEDEPVAPTGRAGQALGGLAIVYLVGRLAFILMKVKAPVAAMVAPAVTAEGHDWGNVKAVGTDLFNGGLFPFEAISILLLVAVVGAIAVARPLLEKDEKDNKDAHTDLGGHA